MAAASASIRRARPLLGTFVEIAAADESLPGIADGRPPCDALEAAVEAAFGAIAKVHALMSFHEPGSDVSRLNRDAAARAVEVHGWTYEVLEAAVDLHCQSGGAFDITVAPALQRLGLLPDVSGLDAPFAHDRQAARGAGAASDLILLLPNNLVRFADPTVRIDLGGIAKGFAVDRAVEALQRHGIMDGIVNAGGDLRVFGPHPHAVDIRDPRRPDRAMFRVALRNAALASSAGRFDPARSHDVLPSAVIDPATAMPAQSISGATVCAPFCMIADALTKVVMNAGENAGMVLEYYGADALFVSSHGDACMTANWKNEVHLAA
jgi:thiamine biosynthesis lipoprotein